MSVIAYLIAAILLGGGVSVASQHALPGDLLYPVKIHVNESVEQALTFSPEAKSKLDSELAITRLQEAETIAAKSKLSADVRATVEANFKEHADRVEARVKDMTAADATASADLIANFETSLQAHSRILAELQSKSDSEDEKSQLADLGDSVDAEHRDAVKEHDAADIGVVGASKASVQSSAEGKKIAASNKISEVQKYIDEKKSGMSAVTLADAVARLATARSYFAQGDVELQAKDYAKAFASYTDAQHTAQEAKLLLDANDELEVEVKGVDESDSERDSDSGRSDVKVEAPSVHLKAEVE